MQVVVWTTAATPTPIPISIPCPGPRGHHHRGVTMSRTLHRNQRRHAPKSPDRRSAAPRRRPRLEVLEDRCVPATIMVNSAADTAAPPTGTVTLRSAIVQAEADTAADAITFAPTLAGQTI